MNKKETGRKKKMKKSKAAVILVAILAAFAGLAYYASIILSSTGIGEEMSIPLGLDLSGGVSIRSWMKIRVQRI